MKVFYVLLVANFVFAAGAAIWGAIRLPSAGQAMIAFAVMVALHMALNSPNTARGTFWLRAVAAVCLMASSVMWLIPAIRTPGY